MRKYRDPMAVNVCVSLVGIDDVTRIEFVCSPAEVDFLRWLEDVSAQAALEPTQPRLTVEEKKP